MELRTLFEDWAQFTGKRFSDRQWLLAKWEVVDGVVWSREKIEVMMKTVIRYLDLKPEHSLADLGCGGGWILDMLAAKTSYSLGVDFSWNMLSNAGSLIPPKRLVQGEIGRLPLKEGAFDRVLCYFVLINMMDDNAVERSLLDMFRVVKKGGRVVVGQMPDRAGSPDYDLAKGEYFDYCAEVFPVGVNHRDILRAPQKLFDKGKLEAFLKKEGVPYRIEPSFNPFYRPGAPETVKWRFDLVLEKR